MVFRITSWDQIKLNVLWVPEVSFVILVFVWVFFTSPQWMLSGGEMFSLV